MKAMLLGTLRRTARLGLPTHRTPIAIRRNGGCTFAEHPRVAAPDARIIWRAPIDPGVLIADCVSVEQSDPDRIDPMRLRRWITSAPGSEGVEHLALSDGYRRIRLDIVSGSLQAECPLSLQYRLAGLDAVDRPVLALRRLAHLYRHGRFSASLFPSEPRTARWIRMLRVADARRAGASHRDIAEVLADGDRLAGQWRAPSEALRSDVRRLIADGQTFAAGGFWSLLGGNMVTAQAAR